MYLFSQFDDVNHYIGYHGYLTDNDMRKKKDFHT